MAEQGFRITYATMSADNEELHRAYDKGIEVAQSWLGQKHSLYVNGEAREGSGHKVVLSPIDSDIVIGEFAQATREDVRAAIAAAKAFSHTWGRKVARWLSSLSVTPSMCGRSLLTRSSGSRKTSGCGGVSTLISMCSPATSWAATGWKRGS